MRPRFSLKIDLALGVNCAIKRLLLYLQLMLWHQKRNFSKGLAKTKKEKILFIFAEIVEN
jgi:hypothetical protein